MPANTPSISLQLVSEYVSALSNKDTERMNALRSPDFALDWVHGDAFDNAPLSEEDTRQFWPAWFAGFPEMDYEVTRTIAAAEVVVTQWIFSGVNAAELGAPVFDPPAVATNRVIRFRGVTVYDVSKGLIQRETTYLDLATLVVELGVEL
ncbi:MAG TPA: SnoaL-like domain-containing protein [Chloroflexi bacterium]|nr:SnoaL-like domain-containing protein [Chloroflexota bacterium]